jgi:Domain of unknown function (DUF5666)
MSSKQTSVLFSRCALASAFSAALITLGACGGGSADPTSNSNPSSAAPSGSGAMGSVTGFGSVIVNGVRYDDSAARVLLDEKGSDLNWVSSELKVGMQVEVKGEGLKASAISVASTLRGPVTAVAPGTLTVLGQTVSVDTDGADAVALEGFTTFSDIKVGDWIEVHAVEAAAGAFKATRIERESSTESQAIRLSGRVAGLDLTGKTFKLGSMTVNFSAAQLNPAQAVLANDMRVRVYSDAAPVGTVVTAKRVKVRELSLAGARDGNIGGVVSEFTSVSNFTVHGVKVDATVAVFKNGVAADLTQGAAVRIKGALKDQVFIANEIEFKKKSGAESGEIKVIGVVTDFVSVSNFKLRGQQIDASAANFSNGKATDLANGSILELNGKIVGGNVVANAVEFVSAKGPVDAQFHAAGKVTDYNATAKTFKLSGNLIYITSASVFVDFAAADLVDGKLVKVELKRNGDKIELLKIKAMAAAELPPLVLRGIATDATATGFKLFGLMFTVDAKTVFENGALADLVNGARVVVKAVAGAYDPKLGFVASKIEFEKRPVASAGIKVEGMISGFESKSVLRVAGVMVDASAAQFKNGVEADLANGKSIRVEGVVSETGILKASMVEFR